MLYSSCYLSTYARDRETLLRRRPTLLFTSVHIAEEGENESAATLAMCHELAEAGYRLIADCSPRSLERFGVESFENLAAKLKLYALRVDFGLEPEELLALNRTVPLAINASSFPLGLEQYLHGPRPGELLAIHNYYPRPETGLDLDYFLAQSRLFTAAQIPTFAFVPGEPGRAPVGAGLPTLEMDRGVGSFAAYYRLSKLCPDLAGAFVGDGALSERDWTRLEGWQKTGILPLPVELWDEDLQRFVQDRAFSIRRDAPAALRRVSESRSFGSLGTDIAPTAGGPQPRPAGSITRDNVLYGRYSGEIQLLLKDFPADPRVNVCGRLKPDALAMLPQLAAGERFSFCLD